jgi:hypothetical protein
MRDPPPDLLALVCVPLSLNLETPLAMTLVAHCEITARERSALATGGHRLCHFLDGFAAQSLRDAERLERRQECSGSGARVLDEDGAVRLFSVCSNSE